MNTKVSENTSRTSLNLLRISKAKEDEPFSCFLFEIEKQYSVKRWTWELKNMNNKKWNKLLQVRIYDNDSRLTFACFVSHFLISQFLGTSSHSFPQVLKCAIFSSRYFDSSEKFLCLCFSSFAYVHEKRMNCRWKFHHHLLRPSQKCTQCRRFSSLSNCCSHLLLLLSTKFQI